VASRNVNPRPKQIESKRRARRERGRARDGARRLAVTEVDAAVGSTEIASESPAPAHTPAQARGHRFSIARAFGFSFWAFVVLAAATGAACYRQLGEDAFFSSLKSDADLLMDLMPRFAAAVLIAAFVQVLLPRDLIARYVGGNSGTKGLVIATAVGVATPGGPMTSFPVVRALRDAGTSQPPLVAYVTSWSTLGFQRVLNWELPLMGTEFCVVRILASLPLPIIAGLISRWFPDPTPEARSDG
jgi:Predicted permease